jgi:hypothetical protein
MSPPVAPFFLRASRDLRSRGGEGPEPGGRGGGYITGVSDLRVRVNVHVAILI